MAPWFMALPWLHYINFKLAQCYHAIRFEKATRYYTIRLEQDLLGDWTLCVTNGRIKSKLGQSRIIAFECFSDAYEHFCLMAKERNQRDYHLVSYHTEDVLFQTILLWECSIEIPVVMQKRKTRTGQKKAVLPQKPTPANHFQLQNNQQMSLNWS
ncbi:TPA: WGR domain-containing protein [Legionella feeleii]